MTEMIAFHGAISRNFVNFETAIAGERCGAGSRYLPEETKRH